MTPREALYHLSMALGPIPITTRDDNLSYQESVIQDAMNTLHTWVDAEVLPSGHLFEITEPTADTAKAWRESYNPAHHIAEHQEQMVSAATRHPLREEMMASGVKIWDWGTGEITDESGNVYKVEARPFNSIEPSGPEVRADGFSTETAGEMDGTAVSHGVGTDYLSYTEELIEDIIEWHYDRNLIDGSTDKDQFCKLIQECGELSDNLCKGTDIRDDIGDIMVVLINIAERNGVCISECLDMAYDDIKDRKGLMVDGVFVKYD
jgi:hypothetical protein